MGGAGDRVPPTRMHVSVRELGGSGAGQPPTGRGDSRCDRVWDNAAFSELLARSLLSMFEEDAASP